MKRKIIQHSWCSNKNLLCSSHKKIKLRTWYI